MAAVIVRLLDDVGQRTAIGQAARRRAEQAFDANRAAEILGRHYRELIHP
jgi:glycosyltransferase involved in cell wall biosynthesis